MSLERKRAASSRLYATVEADSFRCAEFIARLSVVDYLRHFDETFYSSHLLFRSPCHSVVGFLCGTPMNFFSVSPRRVWFIFAFSPIRPNSRSNDRSTVALAPPPTVWHRAETERQSNWRMDHSSPTVEFPPPPPSPPHFFNSRCVHGLYPVVLRTRENTFESNQVQK